MKKNKQLPYADQSFNSIIAEIYKKTEFPLKASDLALRYSEAVFKVKQTTPNYDDSTYEIVAQMNYQAASEQIRSYRLKLLEQWSRILVNDLSIQKCLPNLNPNNFEGKVTQQLIDNLPHFFDFGMKQKDETHQIGKMIEDLQLLFLKTTQSIMDYYGLRDQFKTKIKDQIDKIRADLKGFCGQCFNWFKESLGENIKNAAKNEPFQMPESKDEKHRMKQIKSAFKKYKDKIKSKVNVQKWLLTESVMKLPLANEQLCIKNQLAKALHNKADFQLKTKPKIYLLMNHNGPRPRFDFIKRNIQQQLINILCYVLMDMNTTNQARESIRAKLFQLAECGVQFDYNLLFEGSRKPKEGDWNPETEETNLLTMINLFLFFNDGYKVHQRNFLKLVYRHLHNFQYGYSNFKVLVALQNMDIDTAQISENLTVSKIFEAETVPERHSAKFNSRISTSTSSSANTNYTRQLSYQEAPKHTLLELLRMQQTNFANKQIEILMTTINVHKLNREFQKLPLVEFEKISNPKIRSRVITICISGFTSQEDVKDQSWRHLITNYDGEIYAMNWESKTVKDLASFAYQRLQGLVVNRIFNAVPILNAMTIVNTLMEAYKTNPFFSAFEESVNAGRMLGHLLPQIFPNCLVNLVGFSLGTELIKECIKVLKKDGKQAMINRVLIMGGVADRGELKSLLAETPFEVVNFHSDHDHTLKILYRICKPLNSPCGLGPVEGPLVENIDCTEFVEGHSKYRNKFNEIFKRIELEDDTHYYYQD